MKYVVQEIKKSTYSILVEAENEEKAVEQYRNGYLHLETLNHEESKITVMPAVEPHPIQAIETATVAPYPPGPQGQVPPPFN